MSESSGGAAGDSSTNNAANNALQITGSIVSILTFIYALGVGLYFYAKTAASSPQEINEFIISLQFSYEEMQRFAHSLANYERERMNVNSNNDNSLDEDRDGIMDEKTISPSPVVHNGRIESIPPARLPHPPPPDPEAQALAAKAYLIEGHTATRLEGLRQLALKVGTMASDGFFRQWSNRVRYVLLQEELGKQVAGKDRLMEELRRVQERCALCIFFLFKCSPQFRFFRAFLSFGKIYRSYFLRNYAKLFCQFHDNAVIRFLHCPQRISASEI